MFFLTMQVETGQLDFDTGAKTEQKSLMFSL